MPGCFSGLCAHTRGPTTQRSVNVAVSKQREQGTRWLLLGPKQLDLDLWNCHLVSSWIR